MTKNQTRFAGNQIWSTRMETNVKPCGYATCTNTILTSSEFRYCEVCRSLVLRNSIALLMEPTSPLMERCDMIFDAMIHEMRPEEILNAVRKVEWLYLEMQKQIKAKELDIYRQKRFSEGVAEVLSKRNAPKAPKAEKKRITKKEKLLKQLGGDSDAVRDLLSEDFSDL